MDKSRSGQSLWERLLHSRMSTALLGTAVALFNVSFPAAHALAAENLGTPDRQGDLPVPDLSQLYLADGTVTIIPHIHCDQAWTADPFHTLENANRIINETLPLLREKDQYAFTMESTEFLRDWLKKFPGKRDEMMRFIKAGRFEWSGTYNMPYEALIGGEELIREYYCGRKWYKKETGFDTRVVWNVDTPGHTFQHPQIMAKAGIKYFFLSGFHPREGGQRIPHPIFTYKSPNGSSVLACTFIQDYAAGRTLGDSERVFFALLPRLIREADDVLKKYGLKNFAVGAGTDMVPPAPTLYEYAQTWNNSVKKPVVKFATSTEFIKEIEGKVALPEMSGEIPNPWCMIHGPTHVDAVAAMRQARVYLTDAEEYASMASLLDQSFEYPKDKLNEAWEAQLLPMDHNWGGKEGLSTDRIYLDSATKARDISKAILDEALQRIANKISVERKEPAVVVFNGLSWKRDGIVEFRYPGARGTNVVDDAGVRMPAERDGDNVRFIAQGVPSVGYKLFYLEKGTRKRTEPFKKGRRSIENEYYRVTLGKRGVGSIIDKETNRELIDGQKYEAGELILFRNSADDVRPENTLKDYERGCERSSDVSGVTIRKDDLRLTLRYTVKTDFYESVQRVVLYHALKRIDFFVDLNWYNEKQKELRVVFPVTMSDKAQISYDVPFGVVEIGKEFDCAWRRQREVQNFMTVSENNLAVTLGTSCAVNDYEDRSPSYVPTPVLQPILIASIRTCGGDHYYYRQEGMHHYRFSLTSHVGDWKNAYRFGYEFNHTLYPVLVRGEHEGDLKEPEKSFISVEPKCVIVSTFKLAEDDDHYVLRCFDMEGKGGKANVELFRPIEKLFETNIIEEEGKEITGKVSKTGFAGEIEPYGIHTYKVVLKR